MSEQLTYETLLEASRRANWRIDDIIGGEKKLDFTRTFLPETYVRSQDLDSSTLASAFCSIISARAATSRYSSCSSR